MKIHRAIKSDKNNRLLDGFVRWRSF